MVNNQEQQYLDLLRELVEVSDTEPLNNDRTNCWNHCQW